MGAQIELSDALADVAVVLLFLLEVTCDPVELERVPRSEMGAV